MTPNKFNLSIEDLIYELPKRGECWNLFDYPSVKTHTGWFKSFT